MLSRSHRVRYVSSGVSMRSPALSKLVATQVYRQRKFSCVPHEIFSIMGEKIWLDSPRKIVRLHKRSLHMCKKAAKNYF